MAKDINIHVNAPGADKAKQDMYSVAQSAKHVGKQTAESQQKASIATEGTTKSLGRMDTLLGKLKGQVAGFIGAWLGLQGIRKLVNWLIEKLERIARIQEDIYQKSIALGEIGQALEFQTGTKGMQKQWATEAAKLQKAGGLSSAQVAQQMLVSMDIAFAAQGGIKNPAVLGIAGELAPFVGAGNLGAEEVTKLFEFAGTAGIAPTADAYKQYFAQLHAGYTSSKATNFGQFMMGLQKGGTAYMSMGGSLTGAISAFAGARAVLPNEALAATLVEQSSRLSGGGYEAPRMAIEQALGVKWDQLSMDQRLGALLQYTASIPESQRSQVLAEHGFPLELTTQIGKMVTPEATRAMATTRMRVGGATAQTVDELTTSYLKSDLGKQRQVDAEIKLGLIKAGPQFADWQTRIQKTKAAHEIIVAKGEDRRILDRVEPYVMAYEDLLEDAMALPYDEMSPKEQERLKMLRGNLRSSIDLLTGVHTVSPFYPTGRAARQGYQYTKELAALQEIHIHHDIIYNPIAGSAADRDVGPHAGGELKY